MAGMARWQQDFLIRLAISIWRPDRLPEVARGKYFVTVSVAQLLPKAENGEQGAKLITPEKYASPRESGLEIDVKPGENQVTFDLVSSTDEGNTGSSGASSEASQSNDTSLHNPTENK